MPRARNLTLPRRLAFTLTELLIAVGVLVIVVLAAAKIFSAASKVSAIAGANADLIQTATAIEQQVRADFANLPRNAFMVLQQVEVNSFGANQSVDPSLGTAEIRADQIAFFTRGARTTTQYTGSQEASSNNGIATTWTPESAVARIYYGHGVQAPNVPVGFDPTVYAAQTPGQPNHEGAPVVPWISDKVEYQRWTDGGPVSSSVSQPQTKASLWPLVRLATLMGTDGLPTTIDNAGNASNTAYPRFGSSAVNASVTLFTNKIIRLGPLATKYPNTYAPLWTSGRVDVVKWQPDDLFSQMAFQANSQQIPSEIPFIVSNDNYTAPWSGPSSRLRMIQTLADWAAPATAVNPVIGANALYLAYPRVEKAGPSASKADQMLTAPVLAANCSSFKVEWTWADGVGRSFSGYSDNTAPTGGEGIGMLVNPRAAQPWFGLDKLANGVNSDLPNSAVRPVSNCPNFTDNGQVAEWGTVGKPLVVSNLGNANANIVCSVEGTINRDASEPATVRGRPVWRCSSKQDSKRVYQAVFGFNQDDSGIFNPSALLRGPYTPLPSAIRITIRLHDPLGRIEGGRDFQFIVDLPKR